MDLEEHTNLFICQGRAEQYLQIFPTTFLSVVTGGEHRVRSPFAHRKRGRYPFIRKFKQRDKIIIMAYKSRHYTQNEIGEHIGISHMSVRNRDLDLESIFICILADVSLNSATI